MTKLHINIMRNADKTRKLEIEQSAFYLGYRLMWVIGLILKGRKIPSGNFNQVQSLTENQHKAFTLNVVDFVTNVTTLDILL